jgi:hypothetical protein
MLAEMLAQSALAEMLAKRCWQKDTNKEMLVKRYWQRDASKEMLAKSILAAKDAGSKYTGKDTGSEILTYRY